MRTLPWQSFLLLPRDGGSSVQCLTSAGHCKCWLSPCSSIFNSEKLPPTTGWVPNLFWTLQSPPDPRVAISSHFTLAPPAQGSSHGSGAPASFALPNLFTWLSILYISWLLAYGLFGPLSSRCSYNTCCPSADFPSLPSWSPQAVLSPHRTKYTGYKAITSLTSPKNNIVVWLANFWIRNGL